MSKQTFSGLFESALKELYPSRKITREQDDFRLVIKAVDVDGDYVGFSFWTYEDKINVDAIIYSKEWGRDTATVANGITRSLATAHTAIIRGIGWFMSHA